MANEIPQGIKNAMAAVKEQQDANTAQDLEMKKAGLLDKSDNDAAKTYQQTL